MQSALLETIVGLALLFTLLSVLASGIQELFSGWLNRRGKMLFDTIDTLFHCLAVPPNEQSTAQRDEPQAHEATRRLFDDTLINPLVTRPADALDSVHQKMRALIRRPPLTERQKLRKRAPSYISSELFAAAAMKKPLTEVPGLPHVLRTFTTAAGKGTDTPLDAQQALMRWYDAVMERVSGKFARTTKFYLMTIGFLIALILNADTIRLARTLYRDPVRRQAAISLAETLVARQANAIQSADGDIAVKTEAAVNLLSSELKKHEAAALPLGWAAENRQWAACGVAKACYAGYSVWTFLGLLMTGVAVSFGAPFWFDILNKVVNLRAGGKRPESSITGAKANATVEIKVNDDRPTEIVAANPPVV